MNRDSTIIKLTCLFLPLGAAVLALHAWGEPLRAKADWYWMRKAYTEHRRAGLDIRVPRGSKAHEDAGKSLGEFLDGMLEEYGEVLRLSDPRDVTPVLMVYMLATEEHVKPHGFAPASEREHKGGRFVPERWAITMVGGGGRQHQEADARLLRHQMMHVLLHLSGERAEWSPWLEEGLAEYFEEMPALPRPTSEELPKLDDLLDAGREDLTSPRGAPLREGARLLVGFLLERHPDRFSDYYGEERRPGPVGAGAFARQVGSVKELESEWRIWAAALK